uniref:Uncharacterized protein n=1 Tax=Anguilla anguilla TaxID=7936 RepID=A0A0E9XLX3_ANGAN
MIYLPVTPGLTNWVSTVLLHRLINKRRFSRPKSPLPFQG